MDDAIAITGGHGFLGWHVACRLRALGGDTPRRVSRSAMQDADEVAREIRGADTILHLAGVVRAATDEDVEQGNVNLASAVADAIVANGAPVKVAFANSVHCESDTAYGRGKARAADILGTAVEKVGGTFADVRLPNLFGEHGRPSYNSFVATFAHEVAHGRRPTVSADREIPLRHVQEAAAELLGAVRGAVDGVVHVAGEPRGISEVLHRLEGYRDLYTQGEIPDLSSPFATNLFNTFRSYTFPQLFPIASRVHSDSRGDLFESVRVHGGRGQGFVSTTVPGATRGDHYHLHKFERFFVVKGEAEIKLRRLLHDDVVTFRLSGDVPAFVDMPTLWVHNIRNVGDQELVTVFWADQLLDPGNPDQYPEKVEPVQTELEEATP